MRRLPIVVVVGPALVLALATAGVFAIWPVVGGAPWLSTERTPVPLEQIALLNRTEVIAGVRWRVNIWCHDWYQEHEYGDPDIYTQSECREDRTGGDCEDHANWATLYRSDRQVWKVECGGYSYVVDDNTGNVSSPYLPASCQQ